MKKNTFISLLAALALMLGANTASASSLSDQDMQMAFGSNIQSQQLAMLSQQEMVETEGEFWWFAPVIFTGRVTSLTLGLGGTALYVGGGYWNDFSNWWGAGTAYQW